MTEREHALQKALEFAVAQIRILLSSGWSCGDRDGAEEACQRAAALLLIPVTDFDYSVVYCRGYDLSDRVILSTGHATLQDARSARQVAGDVVVWTDTGKIVRSDEWLEDWELGNPDSYAYKMTQLGHTRR